MCFQKYLFTDGAQMPQVLNRMQSTPMLPPLSSRLAGLPLDFELSPIIRQENGERQSSNSGDKDALSSNNFTPGPTTECTEEHRETAICSGQASTSSGFGNTLEPTHIELSTWIGGTKRSELNAPESGFSQWLDSGKEDKYAIKPAPTSVSENESPLIIAESPMGIHRDNTPSSLQRPDKHSQHSSLQNIQGDLNDILDRLQNMVADDCLLEGESYSRFYVFRLFIINNFVILNLYQSYKYLFKKV